MTGSKAHHRLAEAEMDRAERFERCGQQIDAALAWAMASVYETETLKQLLPLDRPRTKRIIAESARSCSLRSMAAIAKLLGDMERSDE